MIKKSGDQFYDLTASDGLGLRVTSFGPAFFVPASIDVMALDLQDGQVFQITPQMMSGAGSYHQLNVHCFFNPPSGKYTIEVLDDAGNVIDTITAQLPAGQPAGTQMYYQLTLWVTV